MTSFHVRHDLTPTIARETLLLLRAAPALDGSDLLTRARAHGLDIGRRQSTEKVIASLRDLGLVTRPREGVRGLALTTLGGRIADIARRDPILFAELIHQRYWWLWTPESDGPHFAWAYQTVTRLLWDAAPTAVDSHRLVGAVIASAEHSLGATSVSFSPSSVLGILHWLRALSPPCIVEAQAQRRPACPPEALALALEGVRRTSGWPAGVPMRLEEAARQQICRATLLDEAALDEMLDQAGESLGLIRRCGDSGDSFLLPCSLLPGLVASQEET
jgi:hypothetical protein